MTPNCTKAREWLHFEGILTSYLREFACRSSHEKRRVPRLAPLLSLDPVRGVASKSTCKTPRKVPPGTCHTDLPPNLSYKRRGTHLTSRRRGNGYTHTFSSVSSPVYRDGPPAHNAHQCPEAELGYLCSLLIVRTEVLSFSLSTLREGQRWLCKAFAV